MPTPSKGESKEGFISEYMSSPEAQKSFPHPAQHLAVAESIWRERQAKKYAFAFLGGNSGMIGGFVNGKPIYPHDRS